MPTRSMPPALGNEESEPHAQPPHRAPERRPVVRRCGSFHAVRHCAGGPPARTRAARPRRTFRARRCVWCRGVPPISVIGSGYLGAVHAACMADLGHDVVGDRRRRGQGRRARRRARRRSTSPACDELLARALATGPAAVHHRHTPSGADADVHFVCVGTPQKQRRVRRRHHATSTPRSTSLAPHLTAGDAGRRQVHRPGRHRRAAAPTLVAAGARRRRCWPGTRSSCARASPSRTPCTPTGSSTACPTAPDGDGRARAARRGLRRRSLAAGTPRRGHRLRHRRAGQGRRQLLPGHQDLLHQRDGRGLRGHRRRRHRSSPTRSATTTGSAASSSTPASASAAAACPRTSARSWPAPASSAPTRR